MTGGIEGAGPRGDPTSQQPSQSEQMQPLQGRVREDARSLQGPATFDGHESDAWERDLAIFKSRTIEGMKALHKNIGGAKEIAEEVSQLYQKEVTRQLAEIGEVDENSFFPPTIHQDKVQTQYFYEGLRYAFNLIGAHIQGKRKWEGPKKGESQEG
jgi:hypothetical protein